VVVRHERTGETYYVDDTATRWLGRLSTNVKRSGARSSRGRAS
jgi:hypothetical protein